MNEKVTAALVGLGAIGMQYDLHASDLIISHARAMSLHPEVEFLCAVDPNPHARSLAESHYGVRTYANIEKMVRAEKPDMVIVAAPTEYHLSSVECVLDAAPKLILCEKPVGISAAETEKIVKLCEEGKAILAVNYPRRFNWLAKSIKDRIASGVWGAPLSGQGQFSGSLQTNGSHMVDLLDYWLGPIDESSIHSRGPGVSTSSGLSWNQGVLFEMQGVGDVVFRLFELRLIFEKAKIEYQNSGLTVRVYESREDILYPGYESLELSDEIQNYRVGMSQFEILDTLLRCLRQGEPIPATGASALRCSRILSHLVER